MDAKGREQIQSVEELFGRFCGDFHQCLPSWSAQLVKAPEELESIERDVHAAFSRGADVVIAGLLAVVMKREDFNQEAEATRHQYAQPLGLGRTRTTKLQLLGGLIIWVSSLYCATRKKSSRVQDESGAGVYIELIQFGVGKGTSPALRSRVARASVSAHRLHRLSVN